MNNELKNIQNRVKNHKKQIIESIEVLNTESKLIKDKNGFYDTYLVTTITVDDD
jgi:hypothetical protein